MRTRLLLLAAMLAVAACSSEIIITDLAAGYPTVDGSTSALPLQRTIACEIYAIECGWAEALWPNTPRMIAPVNQEVSHPVNDLWHSGTHDAYENLISGETDLILVARQPSDSELADAAETGVELYVRPVALDAFVFLANVNGPASDLSLETIRAIYSGRITHWDQAVPGAVSEPITTYKRNENSGSQELMESLVMKGIPMVETSTLLILPTMMDPINMLSSDRFGIGYSVYFYAEHIFPAPGVRLLAVDGVTPTAETIGNGTYPLTAEVYVAIRGDEPSGSSASHLRDWLLTEDGQETVAKSGYVPLP